MKATVFKAFVVAGFVLALGVHAITPPRGSVVWIWSGAVTPRSAVVKARLLHHDGNPVRLAVSETPDLRAPRYSAAVADPEAERRGIVSSAIAGLAPDTRYFYALEVDGRLPPSAQGSFRTFPAGPSSFRFAFGSCAATGSESPIFLAIRDENPLFFVNLGDLHYENIDDDSVDEFLDAYDAVLTSGTQSALYRQVPVVYMWDDHDFGDSTSDRTSPSRRAARATYREVVPHYPLAAGSGDVPIYQSFQVGRVYFILTDGRSERSPLEEPDGGRKSVLGAEQKRWLEGELLEAAAKFPLVVWMQGNPWIGSGSFRADPWWSYDAERREIATFIARHRIRNLLMLAGDAHMVAIDDGRNNRYADEGGAGFPVFHAAPLDKGPSVKGGPYSQGISTVRGQYGLVEIFDDGGESLSVRLTGKTALGPTPVTYSFSVPEENRLAVVAGDAPVEARSGERR